MRPGEYWRETDQQRIKRIEQQEADRRSLVNDWMELVYQADMDELLAELMRLHEKIGEARTQELIDRISGERSDRSTATDSLAQN